MITWKSVRNLSESVGSVRALGARGGAAKVRLRFWWSLRSRCQAVPDQTRQMSAVEVSAAFAAAWNAQADAERLVLPADSCLPDALSVALHQQVSEATTPARRHAGRSDLFCGLASPAPCTLFTLNRAGCGRGKVCTRCGSTGQLRPDQRLVTMQGGVGPVARLPQGPSAMLPWRRCRAVVATFRWCRRRPALPPGCTPSRGRSVSVSGTEHRRDRLRG